MLIDINSSAGSIGIVRDCGEGCNRWYADRLLCRAAAAGVMHLCVVLEKMRFVDRLCICENSCCLCLWVLRNSLCKSLQS